MRCHLDFKLIFGGIRLHQSQNLIEIEVYDFERIDSMDSMDYLDAFNQIESNFGTRKLIIGM